MSKVLVLGATGGIGGEVARQLSAAGWEVCALTREVDKARRQNPALTWLKGDALDRAAVIAAARGCAVIVHGVNPPGYRHWAEQVLPMIDNSIAAAIAEGATIVLPGTVYNFGPDAFPVLHEDSPQHPQTRKGAIRVQLEQRLREASQQGARVLIVRAGDFFGTRLANNWFAQGLVKPGKPVRRVSYPGAPGVAHQWAYLPDVARTVLELIERYRNQKEEVRKQAEKLEATSKAWDEKSEQALHQHHRWAQAMTAIQIAISLAAITLLTRKEWLKRLSYTAAGVAMLLGSLAWLHV